MTKIKLKKNILDLFETKKKKINKHVLECLKKYRCKKLLKMSWDCMRNKHTTNIIVVV